MMQNEKFLAVIEAMGESHVDLVSAEDLGRLAFEDRFNGAPIDHVSFFRLEARGKKVVCRPVDVEDDTEEKVDPESGRTYVEAYIIARFAGKALFRAHREFDRVVVERE
jgi:hypothetical protein